MTDAGADLDPGPALAPDPALDAAEVRLAALEASLGDVDRRLDAGLALAEQPAHFSIGEPSPEEAFAAELRAAGGEQPVSYGLGDMVGGLADIDAKGVMERLQRMLDSVRYAAKVETRHADALAIVSIVGWGGDTQTVVAEDTPGAVMGRHRRRVAVDLRTRQAKVRFVTIVLAGAAKVAVAAYSGGVAALPTVYRFAKRVVDEFETLEAATAAA